MSVRRVRELKFATDIKCAQFYTIGFAVDRSRMHKSLQKRKSTTIWVDWCPLKFDQK